MAGWWWWRAMSKIINGAESFKERSPMLVGPSLNENLNTVLTAPLFHGSDFSSELDETFPPVKMARSFTTARHIPLLTLFLTLTIGVPVPGPDALTSTEIQAMEHFMGDVMACANIPGLALGIVRGGATYETGLGIAHMDTGHPVDKKTIFNLGSAAKAFVPYVLAELMNGQENSLDNAATDLNNVTPLVTSEFKLFNSNRISLGYNLTSSSKPFNNLQYPSTSFNTLQHPSTPFNTLQHPSKPFNILQNPSTPFNTLQHPSKPFNILQHPSTPSKTLQHPSTPFNILQHPSTPSKTLQHPSTSFNTLQHPLTPFNILQHPSTPFIILQHPSTSFNTLQHPLTSFNTLKHPSTPFNTLHHPSTPFIILQHPSTSFNTLQINL
ncbi:hypothetical protein Btru_078056 [Bulinus truncatus]|nr:hypothetical protein Btru_078056 [Bulinus truncatus]